MQLELVTALEARGAYPPLPSIIWFRIVSESELESYFRVGSDSFINSFRKRHRGWRSKRLRREILFK